MSSTAYISRRLRQLVLRRAKFRCEYCQTRQALCPESFEIDHIVPRVEGGATDAENLSLACPLCNNAKAAQTTALDPDSGRRVPRFHPRRQVWSRHFTWGDDDSRIFGRTASGRATVVALDVNRPRVIRLRRLWLALGLHPPSDS